VLVLTEMMLMFKLSVWLNHLHCMAKGKQRLNEERGEIHLLCLFLHVITHLPACHYTPPCIMPWQSPAPSEYLHTEQLQLRLHLIKEVIMTTYIRNIRTWNHNGLNTFHDIQLHYSSWNKLIIYLHDNLVKLQPCSFPWPTYQMPPLSLLIDWLIDWLID
jgi:hypothetical protein